MPGIILSTKCLSLRRLRLSDADALYRYRSLPEVTRFQPFKPRHPLDAVTFIRSTSVKPDVPGTWYQLGLFLLDNRELIGDIGIHFCSFPEKIELGCTVSPAYWGQGYATEALSAVISYLYFKMGKQLITAIVDRENTRSCALFRNLGFFIAQSDDWEVYRLDNNHWQKHLRTNAKCLTEIANLLPGLIK